MYNPQETFERIKEIRESRGITVSQLNIACDLGENTIASSAKSKNGLSAKALYDIAEALGCSVDEILGRGASTINCGDVVESTITNSYVGHGNNITAASPEMDADTKEVCRILKALTPRKRHELIGIIFDFADENL